MKGDIGITEHQDIITSIDNDSTRKWVLTTSKNLIKIWNYKKLLIANIQYHEEIR
jgi:hypothetical protein